MSKHHLQSLIEQITNTGHGSAPFHYGKKPDRSSKLLGSVDIQTKADDLVEKSQQKKILGYSKE